MPEIGGICSLHLHNLFDIVLHEEEVACKHRNVWDVVQLRLHPGINIRNISA